MRSPRLWTSLTAVLIALLFRNVYSEETSASVTAITSHKTKRMPTTLSSTNAVIIGSGLAGLTTALTILDAGGRVVILEKEENLGGNSMKASSGINAVTENEKASFRQDTLQSAGSAGDAALIEQLIRHSEETVLNWLRTRLGVDLSQISQLGGHSQPRTHRPGGKLPIGAEIMIRLQKAVKEFEDETRGSLVSIFTKSRAKQLMQDEITGRVTGVKFEIQSDEENNESKEIFAEHIVLATGGFAADRSSTSWLARVRPELLNLATTAGGFSTGDGLSLATSAGASLVDMEHIQVHPTGFVDPKDPDCPNKFLAAEVLRGVGGILLNRKGER